MPRRSERSENANAADTVHALHVRLLDIDPPIYRELLVRSGVTLDRLHEILIAAFSWDGGHLHQFIAPAGRITDIAIELDPDEDDLDETKFRLRDVLPRASSKLTYEYDFGDGWQLVVDVLRIDAVATGAPRVALATLVGGARAAPPEDCGGIGGYEDLCAAMIDPSHEARDELLEWLGDVPFDPEAFPRGEIVARLKHIR